jgi:DNA-binding beta-propeller fold protein YncE
MDNKIKQVCFWTIFLSAVIFFGLFLYKENSSLWELGLANIVVPLRENKTKSAESQEKNAKTVEKEIQIVNPGVKQSKEITNPVGQIVHHLFNIDGVPSPKAAAFTPDGKEIWVTSLLNKKRGIFVFNALNGEYITDINLEDGGGVEIIFSSDGKKAHVSQMETAQVFEVDTASKKILRTFDTKSAWTKILEFSFDEKKIFAANWSGDDVSEIDLESGKTVRRIPTVDTPRGLYATKNGKYLYVAGFGRGEIEKIDLSTGKGKIIFKSSGAMRHITADEEKGIFYVSDMGKNVIWKVNLNNDEVTKFADTDVNTNTIDLSPDKKTLFVSCRGLNFSQDNYYVPGPEWGSVLLFDTETGEILDAIVGGNQPTALDVSPDGKYLVFSDFLDGRLKVYEIPSYEKLKNGNGGRSRVYKGELKK